MTTVTLYPLDFTTSGLFACEISTEAPHFKTVQTTSVMTVIGKSQFSANYFSLGRGCMSSADVIVSSAAFPFVPGPQIERFLRDSDRSGSNRIKTFLAFPVFDLNFTGAEQAGDYACFAPVEGW